ncbi:MAG: hypothetical protein L6Q35_12905, partial [Phycisphaerales bacterium]|nr:hypothetical protein [Phycisphaerales bacterium]
MATQGHAHAHGHHDHDHSHGTEAHPFNADHAKAGMACCSHHEIEIERYILLCLIGGVLLLSSSIVQLLG